MKEFVQLARTEASIPILSYNESYIKVDAQSSEVCLNWYLFFNRAWYTIRELRNFLWETDVSGKSIYYECEELARLVTTKDDYCNIVKHVDHHIKTNIFSINSRTLA